MKDYSKERADYFGRMAKLKKQLDNEFTYMDAMNCSLPNHKKRYIECNGRRFDNPEQFERYLINEGINPDCVKSMTNIVPNQAGTIDIVFRFKIEGAA
jgi:hypothetical protein